MRGSHWHEAETGSDRGSIPTSAGQPQRAALHAGLGVLYACIALLFATETRLLFVWGILLLAAGIEALRLFVPRVQRLLLRVVGSLIKPEEYTRPTGASYLALSGALLFSLFDINLAASLVIFQAAGDPLAGIVGRLAHGPRVMGKSLAGSAAYIAAGSIAWTALFAAGMGEWTFEVTVGLLIASAIEVLSLPPDDNLSAPVGAALVITLLWYHVG